MKPLTIGPVSIPTGPVPLALRIVWCNAKRAPNEVDDIRLDFAAASLAVGNRPPPSGSLLDFGDVFAEALVQQTPLSSDGERWAACRMVALELLNRTWGGPPAVEAAEAEVFSDPAMVPGPSPASPSPALTEGTPSSG